MTTPAAQMMTEADARRITERIRFTATTARESIEKLQRLVTQAQEGQAHVVLGYKSWTAYLADVLGSEPLRLPREKRQELVGYLAGEGMSTRAIAPVVGVSHTTVRHDIAGGNNFPPAVNTEAGRDFPPEPGTVDTKLTCRVEGDPERRRRSAMLARDARLALGDDSTVAERAEWINRQADEVHEGNPSDVATGGEVTPAAPAVTGQGAPAGKAPGERVEASPPLPPRRPVTGLDGKTYTRPPAAPRATPRRPLPDQFFDAAYDMTRAVEKVARLTEDDRFPQNVEKVAAKHRSDLIRARDLLQQVIDRLATES